MWVVWGKYTTFLISQFCSCVVSYLPAHFPLLWSPAFIHSLQSIHWRSNIVLDTWGVLVIQLHMCILKNIILITTWRRYDGKKDQLGSHFRILGLKIMLIWSRMVQVKPERSILIKVKFNELKTKFGGADWVMFEKMLTLRYLYVC